MKYIIIMFCCCTLLWGCSHNKPKEDPYALAQIDYKAGHYDKAAAASSHPKALTALNMLTDDTRVRLPG